MVKQGEINLNYAQSLLAHLRFKLVPNLDPRGAPAGVADPEVIDAQPKAINDCIDLMSAILEAG